MKNLYLLPTDKPSRLVKLNIFGKDKLHLYKDILPIQDEEQYQNIYITSSENIKEGDWMYYKHFGEDIVTKYNTWGGQNTNVNEHKDYYKKIILTTDVDLIKDGWNMRDADGDNSPNNNLHIMFWLEEIYYGSDELIGNVTKRFKDLEHKNWDWRSFYNGWLEGRSMIIEEIGN
jgi:hypothetical protein